MVLWGGYEHIEGDTFLAIIHHNRSNEADPLKRAYFVNPHAGQFDYPTDETTKNVTIIEIAGRPLSDIEVEEMQQGLAELN